MRNNTNKEKARKDKRWPILFSKISWLFLKVLREAAAKGTSLEDMADLLNVEDISSHLYTADMPDPDLLIRTSGEQRLSGFMTWQSAYSEFYFCRALWPDFTRVDFLRALRDYANRSRRFGS